MCSPGSHGTKENKGGVRCKVGAGMAGRPCDQIRASGCRLPMSGLLHARSVTAGLELTVRLARGRGVCDAALDKEDVPDGGARCRMDGAHQWNATAVSGWGMTGGAGILEE